MVEIVGAQGTWIGDPKEIVSYRTLGDLLSSVDLGDLFLDQLITLLADFDNLCAGNNQLGHLSKNLLGNLGRRLVLGQSIGVVEGVVCTCMMLVSSLALRAHIFPP